MISQVEDIEAGVAHLHSQFHRLHKSKSLQYRLLQLQALGRAIQEYLDAFADALYEDFKRARHETVHVEVASALREIEYYIDNLPKWNEPEQVSDLPPFYSQGEVWMERIPMGVVLIISPFNYPILLSIDGILGNIVAGNSIVVKPSEATPRFTKVFGEALSKHMDPDTFLVVNGAVPHVQKLLSLKFDKIMYTGSKRVGTLVAQAAAKTLTPCLLELGGKSPAIVLEDVSDKDIEVVASKIVFGKLLNGGQTCVAVDYVLVHASKRAKLVQAIQDVISQKYPSFDSETPFTHLINRATYERLTKAIDTSQGTRIVLGANDESSNLVAPTILDNVSWTDSSMEDELFGPVLPVVEFDNLDDAIAKVIHHHDCPLSAYIFTGGKPSREHPLVDTILTRLRLGFVMINDSIMCVNFYNAPFGGIGSSGYGNYHGKYSMREFSHERAICGKTIHNNYSLL